MSADWKHHVVTVEIIHDEPRVKFECSAPEDGPCRTYPTPAIGPKWEGCECEVWNECDDHLPLDDGGCGLGDDAPTHDRNGHLFAAGQKCWVEGWFNGDGAVYTGPDANEYRDDYAPTVARVGEVDVSFDGEVVEWQWHYPHRMGLTS